MSSGSSEVSAGLWVAISRQMSADQRDRKSVDLFADFRPLLWFRSLMPNLTPLP